MFSYIFPELQIQPQLNAILLPAHAGAAGSAGGSPAAETPSGPQASSSAPQQPAPAAAKPPTQRQGSGND